MAGFWWSAPPVSWTDDRDFPNLKDAIRKIEKAIELEPTLATAYQGLGLLRSWDGDAQGALQAAKRSVELGPGDADNLLFLGRALASVGEFDQALARTRHAMALNPFRPAYAAPGSGASGTKRFGIASTNPSIPSPVNDDAHSAFSGNASPQTFARSDL